MKMNILRFCRGKQSYVDKITKLWKQGKWSENCKNRQKFKGFSHKIINVTAFILLDKAMNEMESSSCGDKDGLPAPGCISYKGTRKGLWKKRLSFRREVWEKYGKKAAVQHVIHRYSPQIAVPRAIGESQGSLKEIRALANRFVSEHPPHYLRRETGLFDLFPGVLP